MALGSCGLSPGGSKPVRPHHPPRLKKLLPASVRVHRGASRQPRSSHALEHGGRERAEVLTPAALPVNKHPCACLNLLVYFEREQRL